MFCNKQKLRRKSGKLFSAGWRNPSRYCWTAMIEKTLQCHMKVKTISSVMENVWSRALWGFCSQTDLHPLRLPGSLCRGPARETQQCRLLLLLISFYLLIVERRRVCLPWHHVIVGLGKKGHWPGSQWNHRGGARKMIWQFHWTIVLWPVVTLSSVASVIDGTRFCESPHNDSNCTVDDEPHFSWSHDWSTTKWKTAAITTTVCRTSG